MAEVTHAWQSPAAAQPAHLPRLRAAPCPPHPLSGQPPQTTDQATLDAVLQEAAELGRPLFALFSHPAPRVADAAAHLMRAIAGTARACYAPL